MPKYDKIVFEPYLYQKPKTERRNEVIRLDRTSFEIIEAIQSRTGLKKMKIASALIKFASEYVEIKDFEFDEFQNKMPMKISFGYEEEADDDE